MRHIDSLCVMSIIVLAIPAPVSSAQSVGSQVRALLPKGAATVEVLAAPGQPLPYDRKLGLTEGEYQEFLRLADSVQMRPTRTETIVIERTSVGWRFGATTTVSAVRGVEIDTVRNLVHSTFGDLRAAQPVTAGPAQRATGRWSGPRWEVESVDSLTRTGTRAAFAVGRHEVTGRTVIYFNAQRVTSGQLVSQESLFLRVTR